MYRICELRVVVRSAAQRGLRVQGLSDIGPASSSWQSTTATNFGFP